MYDNDFKTKGNKIKTKIIKLNHNKYKQSNNSV